MQRLRHGRSLCCRLCDVMSKPACVKDLKRFARHIFWKWKQSSLRRFPKSQDSKLGQLVRVSYFGWSHKLSPWQHERRWTSGRVGRRIKSTVKRLINWFRFHGDVEERSLLANLLLAVPTSQPCLVSFFFISHWQGIYVRGWCSITSFSADRSPASTWKLVRSSRTNCNFWLEFLEMFKTILLSNSRLWSHDDSARCGISRKSRNLLEANLPRREY